MWNEEQLPGATRLADGSVRFVVWAPLATNVRVSVWQPARRMVRMQREPAGYWSAVVTDLPAGGEYLYRLEKSGSVVERPDPASRSQPRGVHGPSARRRSGIRLERHRLARVAAD